jgi:hypothetical protein
MVFVIFIKTVTGYDCQLSITVTNGGDKTTYTKRMLIWAHSFGGLSSPSVGPVALGLW